MGDSDKTSRAHFQVKPDLKTRLIQEKFISPVTDRLVSEMKRHSITLRLPIQGQSRPTHVRVSSMGEMSTRTSLKPAEDEELLNQLQTQSQQIRELEEMVRRLKQEAEKISFEKSELDRKLTLTKEKLKIAVGQVRVLKAEREPSHLSESIDKYLNFFLHRSEAVPLFSQVLKERTETVSLHELVTAKRYTSGLLICLQLLSDLVLCEVARSNVVHKGTQTAHLHTTDRPASSLVASNAVSPRGHRGESEYLKMMVESDQLLASISEQSGRIASLNEDLFRVLGRQEDWKPANNEEGKKD